MALTYNGSHRCITLSIFVLSVLICLSLHAPTSSAFYIPGVAPTEYRGKENIGIRVRIKYYSIVNIKLRSGIHNSN